MPHPKVLGFRALYFAAAYGIFLIFKCYFSFFLAAARKIARLPEKNSLPDSEGLQPPPQPPAHTSMGLSNLSAMAGRIHFNLSAAG